MMEEKYIAPKDAAEILVVKKTTVYDMIKQGRLKAVKIGKQFRIRESDVLALVGDSPQDPGAAGQESLLLCGQDMLLDHLCARVNAAEGYQAVSRSYLGSYNGLFALYQGQANFATAHLWDWETDQYNRPIGIYTAPGNPKGITCVEDFAREDVRMVNREKGSGIRVLTDSLFLRAGLSAAEINGYDCIEHSHMAAAAAVARGEADCAVGNERSVLGSREVDFLPLRYEQYDLIVPISELGRPVVQRVLEVLRSDALRMETAALGGYDVTDMGKRLL